MYCARWEPPLFIIISICYTTQMSRRSKSRSSRSTGRGFKIITANHTRLPRSSSRMSTLQILGFNLDRSAIPDGRFYHPERVRLLRPVRSVFGSSVPLTVKIKRKNLHANITFSVPAETYTCVRRSIRREVIFASGLGGRRSTYRKRHVRRNASSSISC